MTSPRQWWRRAASALKDRRSLYLSRLTSSPELEAAVVRATSHDDRSVDYKNSARVFAWARTSPSYLHPLMWALAKRAVKTRSWPVALKSLMLTHGLLMRADSVPIDERIGRLPFDLSDFKDRASDRSKMWGFSTLVRAYFTFLDNRSVFATFECDMDNEDELLDRVEKLQTLLGLLMQIRPYGNGMEVGLVLEAMDCVLIEIFEVYSQICNGIAKFLLGIFGPCSDFGDLAPEGKRKRGSVGMRVLRRAHQQSAQLSTFFELCKGLGVLNAAELPDVEKISEEDILDLERLVSQAVKEEKEKKEMETPVERQMEGSVGSKMENLIGFEMEGPVGKEMKGPVGKEMKGPVGREMASLIEFEMEGAVGTSEWVVFEDEQGKIGGQFGKKGNEEGRFGNKNLVDNSWEMWVGPNRGVPFGKSGNLIELI